MMMGYTISALKSSCLEKKQVDESARKSFCVAPVQHPNCLESAYLQAAKICKIIMLTHPEDSRIFGVFVSRDFEVVCRDYGDHDGRLPRKDYNRLHNYDKENDKTLDQEDPNYKDYDLYQSELGRKVPFIIWTKDMKGTKLN